MSVPMAMPGTKAVRLFFAGLIFITFFLSLSCGAQSVYIPPDGKTLLFIGQNKQSADDYVKAFGRHPAGFMMYTSVQKAQSLQEAFDDGAGVVHGQYLVEKYPVAALQIGLYMVDALDGIVRGNYDDTIDRIGLWIASTKRPVYLRIGYEFDGPHNHYDPRAYVPAYRYIVDRYRKAGIRNVSYVWHSFASTMKQPPAVWYPGDDYVDWFGVSFFDNGTSPGMNAMVAMAKEHGKPLMIAEATPMKIGVGAGKQAYYRWFRPLFKFIEKNNVKMLCYINADWDSLPMFAAEKWKDSRVQTNDEIKKIWLEETSKDRYNYFLK